jgi:hypothetical protein
MKNLTVVFYEIELENIFVEIHHHIYEMGGNLTKT